MDISIKELQELENSTYLHFLQRLKNYTAGSAAKEDLIALTKAMNVVVGAKKQRLAESIFQLKMNEAGYKMKDLPGANGKKRVLVER